MMSEAADLRALHMEIVEVCRMLWQRNLIAASDGNVSARCADGVRLVTTPSGVPKGRLDAADLVIVDLDGNMLAGAPGRVPSAELRLHLEIYRRRPDVAAVVHAHPPITTALTVAGVSLAPCILPETLVTLGTIVTTAYATPTSARVPEVVRPLIADHDALVLDRHGAVTVGRTATEAYTRMEKVENTAQVIAAAHGLGHVQLLPLDEIRRLSAARGALLGGRAFRPDCARCGACGGLVG